MANDLRTRYEIELAIEGTDKLNSQVANIDRSLEAISKNAKSLKFDDAAKGVADLEKYMNGLLESESDCTKQWSEFERASTKAYNDLEKEAVRLNHSISEQGRLQRERIKELEQEKSALGSTKEEKARAREIDKEIASIRKQVVVASDAELQSMQKANVNARARLKLLQQESKAQKAQGKEQKTLLQLIKEDLKPLKDKIAAQKEFIKSLSTTEDKYLAIKKAAKGAMSIGGKALKGAGVVAGAAFAIGGMAVASADKQVTQETEARRMKGGGSLEEKQNTLLELYGKTGADYSTIVDAINRVYGLLGNVSKRELVEAATAEIKMPGAAAILRQQNTEGVKAQDFTAYLNRMRSIQSVTGASTEQIANASSYISNLRQRNFSGASEAELQTLYLALQNSGAYDSEEELQRAFTRFVRKQRDSGESVFALAQKWQNSGEWTKSAEGATDKTQVANTIGNLDFAKMGELNRVKDFNAPQETAAEKTSRELRELEVLKDKFLIQVLKAIAPMLEDERLSKLVDSSLKLIQKLADFLIPLIEKLSPYLQKMVDLIIKLADFLLPILDKVLPYVDKVVDYFIELFDLADDIAEAANQNGKEAQRQADALFNLAGYLADAVKKLTGSETQRQVDAAKEGNAAGMTANSGGGGMKMMADGGLTAMPSICGETAFPEFVIPTDPARRGRAEQIMQTVSQTFNMGGSETTAMSLAQAVRSRQFTYETGRIGMLNRRLGVV